MTSLSSAGPILVKTRKMLYTLFDSGKLSAQIVKIAENWDWGQCLVLEKIRKNLTKNHATFKKGAYT
jgi:hypothetical protein